MKDDLKQKLKKIGAVNVEDILKTIKENDKVFTFKNDNNFLLFLANCLHESQHFKKVKENLNYTTEERLVTVFPKAFGKNGKYKAKDYIREPEKLADLVYDDRIFPKGLGNVNDGDGSKFMGRGYIQTTGRANYKRLSDGVNIDFLNSPELLEQPKFAIISALFFWFDKGINKADTVEESRKKVAGSLFGLKEVKDILNKIS